MGGTAHHEDTKNTKDTKLASYKPYFVGFAFFVTS
jgi:hypothetical protein